MIKPKSLVASAIITLLLGILYSSAYPQEKAQIQHTPSRLESYINVFLPFDGAWLPNIDSSLIGSRNYKTLQNLRYTDTGIEGVNGYTKINTSTIDSVYYKPYSGFQYKKKWPDEDHIFLQCYNSSMQTSRVYQNIGEVPNQSNFVSTPIIEDEVYSVATGATAQFTRFSDTHQTRFSDTLETRWADTAVTSTLTYTSYPGRFSPAPRDQVAYSNSQKSYIWAGDETNAGIVILASTGVTHAVSGPREYTNELANTYTDANNIMPLSGSGGTVYWIVGFPRALSGLSVYVKTANSSAAQSVEVAYYSGVTWIDLDETDGTNGLTQSGQITFSSTVDIAKPKFLVNSLLYWYQVQCVVGTAEIYHLTVNAPWQEIRDIWDGVPRTCISFQVKKAEGEPYDDYTLDVAEESSELYPIGAKVGNITGPDNHFIAIFEDRLQAIQIKMLTGNTESILSGMTVYYSGGSDFQIASSLFDGTQQGTTPFAKTGVITWNPPDLSSEKKQEMFGVYGYVYKIAWEGTLGGTGSIEDAVIIDVVYGIPAPLSVKNFKFPVFYKNRLLLAGYLKGNEAHRVDFCAANAPDVWNGTDSSNDGLQSLYFGNGGELTCGIELYNRLGSNIYSNLLMFEDSKMYALSGKVPTGTDSFNIDTVSNNVGCPAPRTLSVVEVGYEMFQDELRRNLAVWLSAQGPMQFDLSVLQPIKGVENYFNQNHADYVGAEAIANAFAWFDPNFSEWNLVVGDQWLVYNFTKRKWYSKNVGSAESPRCAFPVRDDYGSTYIYAGIDTGYMMRLENGYTWDGTAITQSIETGNFIPSDHAWHEGTLRRLKFAYKVLSEAATLQVTLYADGATSGTSLMSIPLSDGTEGYPKRYTEAIPKDSVDQKTWLYRLGFSTETSSTNRGLQPLGWGYQYRIVREDD